MCGRLILNGLYTVCTELNVNIRTFRDEKRPQEKRNSSQKRPHIMNFKSQNRTVIVGYPVITGASVFLLPLLLRPIFLSQKQNKN